MGKDEIDNLELAQFIAKVQNKDLNYEMVDFHSQRPGHDLRYSLDGSKMAEMGWTPKSAYEQLETTINWTLKMIDGYLFNYLLRALLNINYYMRIFIFTLSFISLFYGPKYLFQI